MNESSDRSEINRNIILEYYNGMLEHKPNFNLDTDLFLKLMNFLPEEYAFGKSIPIIVLFYRGTTIKQVCEWKIDENGIIEGFTKEGICEKLEKAYKSGFFENTNLQKVVRGWKLETLINND